LGPGLRVGPNPCTASTCAFAQSALRLPPPATAGQTQPGVDSVRHMYRWLKRLALAVLVGAVARRLLDRSRHDRARSGVAPTIGGDTWPPVPVNPVGKG
jgi:hypothetical protein